MDPQIEEIKNRLNIVDIIGGYVKLSKTGINYRGLCPFHSEKKPSFFVSPTRQLWKCFGCNKGGDIFEFVKEIEGIEFGDALRILAHKAGVELKKEHPKLKSERKRLYEICELATSFFEKQLQASTWGRKAKEYLLKRGIKEESIKKWRLGYSPDTWQSLSDFLVGRGYKREEIVKAGLAVPSEKKEDPYDRFRGRIIFPIFDLNSQVIGFGARVFKESGEKEVAKYINTPQTLLYDKSSVLYGLNFAKVALRKNNHCVLTEGYTDVIMAHQAGFENTVAVSGTALTQKHLEILRRYSENLILAFDMDTAGTSATRRGIELAESLGFNIKVIQQYQDSKDPADIIKENPQNWQKLLEEARTIMDFYFDVALSSFDKNTAQGKKEIAKFILPAIGRIQSKIEQSYWVKKLSDTLGVKEEIVFEEMKKINSQEGVTSLNYFSEDIRFATPELRKKLLEEKIISLIFKDKEMINLVEESYYPLFSDLTKTILEKTRGENFIDWQDFIKTFPQDSDFRKFLEQALFRAEIEEVEMRDSSEISEEFKVCLTELKKIELRRYLGELREKIKNEEDSKKKEELIKEFYRKAQELHQVNFS